MFVCFFYCNYFIPTSCFPVNYDLQKFKGNINHRDLSPGILFFLFLFLSLSIAVTICILVALSPCQTWNDKNVIRQIIYCFILLPSAICQACLKLPIPRTVLRPLTLNILLPLLFSRWLNFLLRQFCQLLNTMAIQAYTIWWSGRMSADFSAMLQFRIWFVHRISTTYNNAQSIRVYHSMTHLTNSNATSIFSFSFIFFKSQVNYI